MGAGGESARRALAGDAREIAALAREYATALEGARGGDALISRVRSLFDAEAVGSLITDAKNTLLIVGLYDGVVAGFARVIERDDEHERPSIEVEAIYIEPPLRRVGIGEAMIEEVVRFAAERGLESIDVVALPGDGATKSFLEATGFRARLLIMQRMPANG